MAKGSKQKGWIVVDRETLNVFRQLKREASAENHIDLSDREFVRLLCKEHIARKLEKKKEDMKDGRSMRTTH